MKILGIILIIFGGIDLLGDWFLGFDLWGGVLGIALPEIIWTWSGYIEIGAGGLLLKLGAGAEAGADLGED